MHTPAERTPRELLRDFQQAMIDFDPDRLAELFSEDAGYEFPFLSPQRDAQSYRGRAEILAGFRFAWGGVAAPPRIRFLDVRVHDTGEPGTVIGEHVFELNNREGERVRSGFVLVLTARDGEITHARDYSDVLRMSVGLGRLPELLAALDSKTPDPQPPAYALSEVTARDPEALERYRALAANSIHRHGGRYLIRGGEVRVAEGEWPADTAVVLVEFPTRPALERWYASPEYAEALAVRDLALTRRLVFLDGAGRPVAAGR